LTPFLQSFPHIFLSNGFENHPSDDINLEVESTVPKKIHRGRRNFEQNESGNRGFWSTDENKKYHWFL